MGIRKPKYWRIAQPGALVEIATKRSYASRRVLKHFRRAMSSPAGMWGRPITVPLRKPAARYGKPLERLPFPVRAAGGWPSEFAPQFVGRPSAKTDAELCVLRPNHETERPRGALPTHAQRGIRTKAGRLRSSNAHDSTSSCELGRKTTTAHKAPNHPCPTSNPLEFYLSMEV